MLLNRRQPASTNGQGLRPQMSVAVETDREYSKNKTKIK